MERGFFTQGGKKRFGNMREWITSRQNPRIRAVCGLAEKKKRREAELFRLDGVKLLGEAIHSSAGIDSVFLREPVNPEVERLLEEAIHEGRLSEAQTFSVSDSVFEKLSEEKSPEGVLTVCRFLSGLHRLVRAEEFSALDFRGEALLLAESLRDPGNLGTVMRSCAALGIDRLILSADCADLYNPKTIRSAMGAIFRLPTLMVATEEIPRVIGSLRASGRRVFAAALRSDAVSIGALSLKAGDCFVIGNEGHGLSEAVIDACDGAAIIPMREGNESLNAAAAAAICIWETVRSGAKEQ